MTLGGVIFDLDGTLVDSKLDFERMRREMQLPSGEPILEAIEAMPEGRQKSNCLDILREHEMRGAEQATVIPGAGRLLSDLSKRGMLLGVLTRNSQESTARVVDRLDLSFDVILTREDVRPKPDPEGEGSRLRSKVGGWVVMSIQSTRLRPWVGELPEVREIER